MFFCDRLWLELISERHSLLRSNLNVATSVFHVRLRLEQVFESTVCCFLI